jgi:hypothetical protein
MNRIPALLVGLVALAAAGRAEARNLLYGHTYTLENLFGRTGLGDGGFLDVKGSGCEGNYRCVETSVGQIRSGASTSWTILPAGTGTYGAPVMDGDVVILRNLDNGNGGYLDVHGAGCWGDNRCVSTATTPTVSSKWKILRDDPRTSTTLYEGQAIHLQNMADANAGYLDVMGYCRDNAYVNNLGINNYRCVATSAGWNRDENSTHWAFASSPNAVAAPRGCVSTNDIGAADGLVDNGVTSLLFMPNGQLQLWNYAGNGTTTDNTGTTGSFDHWGIDSSVPLTGANAAHLCFGLDGDLRLVNSANQLVWHSFKANQQPISNPLLLLDGCTVSITGTRNGQRVTTWSATTDHCDARNRGAGVSRLISDTARPAPACWDASATNQRLLWDGTTHLELDWQNGLVTLRNTDDGRLWWAPWVAGHDTPAYDTSRAFQLCHRTDGTLTVHDSADRVLWSLGAPSISLLLDAGGFGFWDASSTEVARAESFTYTWREQALLTGDTETEPYAEIAHSRPGWCVKDGFDELIVSKPGEARLGWEHGFLMIRKNPFNIGLVWTPRDANGNDLWGDTLCFQNDGNLVIYRAGSAVWASNTGVPANQPTPHYVLVVEGTQVTMVDEDKAGECNDFNACLAAHPDTAAIDCEHPGSIPSYYATELSRCSTPDYYTVWNPTAVAGVSTFTTGGGFSFIKDTKEGDDNFGIEAWIGGAACDAASAANLRTVATTKDNAYMRDRVLDIVPPSPPADYTMAMGDTGAQLTLFGATPDHPIVEMFATAEGENDTGLGHFEVDVKGVAVFSATAATSDISVEYDHELPQVFEWSTTFYVGVPVVVEGSIGGSAGISAEGTLNETTLSVTTTPFLGFDASLSAGVGTTGASAGVEGSINYIQGSVPFTHSLTFTGADKGYDESAKIRLSGLSGTVSLYAKAGPLKATKQLAGWDGMTFAQDTLYHVSGGL